MFVSAVALLAAGMAASFASRRALRRPVLAGEAERKAFWPLLAVSALVLVDDLAALRFTVHALAGSSPR
jgi:hypothetical protein